jgi:phage shock protein PspC (stress-responsive transcriptional regulator)/tetrahydromethanopterin S-methyltransferase subunit G
VERTCRNNRKNQEMNKTEKVSIGRFAFTFDESAFVIVNNYLNELERFYLSQDGGSEIMEGIEERIAELLRERFSTDNVISQKDIEEIINIIGKPEAIEEESSSSQTKQDNKPSNRLRYDNHRRLYRDLSNKMIGGVCSGLASYFDIDILLVRVITIILCIPGVIFGHHFPFIFPIPLIYIILWICIPSAKTARQRWEMRGDTGSLNDIRKNVENGANEMGDFVQRVGSSNVGRALGRAMSIFVGLILLLIALGGLGFLCITIFGIGDFCYFDGPFRAVQTLLEEFPVQYDIGKLLIMIIILTPLILLIYGSVLLIFNLRSPKFKPGLILFIIWLLSIIAMFIGIFAFNIDRNKKDCANSNSIITETITRTHSDTINIDSITGAKMIRTTIEKSTQSFPLE